MSASYEVGFSGPDRALYLRSKWTKQLASLFCFLTESVVENFKIKVLDKFPWSKCKVKLEFHF